MEFKSRRAESVAWFIILAMFISGALSALIVIMDMDRPNCHRFLWSLPLTYSFICLIIANYRDLLFTRISITAITGLYWIRMVVEPIIMRFGAYAVIPENTSWKAYMGEAYLLECYEALVVFLLIAYLATRLRKPAIPDMERPQNIEKMRYAQPFYFILICMIVYIAAVLIKWPAILRSYFVLIVGTPSEWKIYNLEQRSLSEGGSGPLGILVTLMEPLIVFTQALLPPVILTHILNKRGKWPFRRIAFCAFILVGIVFLVATESRGNSVVFALALLITLMAYSTGKEKRAEAAIIVLLGICAVLGLWTKQGASADGDELQTISRIITSYFSGPQNIAASIEATKVMGGADPGLIPVDILRFIPYILTPFMDTTNIMTAPITSTLFNDTLYGVSNTWDQLIPAIGQGYMHFGFLLAPINPCITICIAIWFEKKARASLMPVWKSICYDGAIFMSLCQVAVNFMLALSFLWYVGIAAIIATFAGYRQNEHYPQRIAVRGP